MSEAGASVRAGHVHSGGSPENFLLPHRGGAVQTRGGGFATVRSHVHPARRGRREARHHGGGSDHQGHRANGRFGPQHRPMGPSSVRVRDRSPERGLLRGRGVRRRTLRHRPARAFARAGRRDHAGQGHDPPPTEAGAAGRDLRGIPSADIAARPGTAGLDPRRPRPATEPAATPEQAAPPARQSPSPRLRRPSPSRTPRVPPPRHPMKQLPPLPRRRSADPER